MSHLQNIDLASYSPTDPLQASTMKHAQTEGQFEGILSPALQLDFLENIANESGRFDSHHILRSDETADLLHLPEEEGEIWLKRSEKVEKKESSPSIASASSVDVDRNANENGIGNGTGNGISNANGNRDGPKIVSTASISAFILNTPLDDIVRNGDEADDMRDVTPQLELPENDELFSYSDGASLRSKSTAAGTETSTNTTARKSTQKSLTRRLSSFFSRSFRRKSGAARNGSQAKRVSYADSAVQATVHRPGSAYGSAAIQGTLQESSSDFAFCPSGDLLALGFSLDIEEALKNQPDSFIFVPLSESGYFSANFEDFEKLPQIYLKEKSSDWSDKKGDEKRLSSPQPPHSIHRRCMNSSQTEAPYVPSSSTARANNTDEVEGPARLAMSQAQRRYQKEKFSQDDARRLSFMEGTSIMESINHLAYPTDQQQYHYSSFSHDNLSNANSTVRLRQAKKLKFKKHPWRWIKSKF